MLYVRGRQHSEQSIVGLSCHIAGFELLGGKDKVYELVAIEKPLPAPSNERGLKELEGHPLVQKPDVEAW